MFKGEKNMARLRRLDFLLIALIYIAFLPVIGKLKLIDFMIFTIFVLSFNLLYGFMGRLSFGHMLYLGIGSYAAALSSVYLSTNPLIIILCAITAGLLVGVILGPVVSRTRGACFALINMAFNQVGYFLVVSACAGITGGEDGLAAQAAPLGFFNLQDSNIMFGFTLFCLIFVFFVMKKLIASPYGVLLKGIKENENRVRFLGYNTYFFKCLTFCISTMIAALAGALWMFNFSYVTPSFIDPGRNVEVVFAALIGGPGSLYGVLIGGGIYMAISNYLASYITRWEMFLGIILLILVFRFPKGLWGVLADKFGKAGKGQVVEK